MTGSDRPAPPIGIRPIMFDAVVFDLDGTLVDSAADLCLAVNALLAEHGLGPLDLPDVKRMIGDGVGKLIERAFAAAGDPPGDDRRRAAMVARFLDIYARDPVANTRPYPGVVEVLRRLHGQGCRLGICTNKPHRHSQAVLAGLGLDAWFGAVIGGDSLPQRKPEPQPLLAAIERLGAAPDEAVMVGDSHNDIEVARRAGIPAIAVSYGYRRGPAEDLKADILIDRFDDLPEALARLGAAVRGAAR